MRLFSMFSAFSLFTASHASASDTLHIFSPSIQLKREAIESEDHPDAREVIYLADESTGTKTPLFYSNQAARGLVRRTRPMSSRGVTFLQTVLENSVSDKATHGTLARDPSRSSGLTTDGARARAPYGKAALQWRR
jgi:hypothetical protein